VIAEREVLGALAVVRDPELDEPITELGFVAAVRAQSGAVEVRLRLPTYFCAPNFAWLMAGDARRALRALPGVRDARVVLEDHFASEAIDAGGRFQDAFAGEADAEPGELRTLFARKGFLARQHAACEPLLRAGRTFAELAGMAVADLPAGGATERYLQRRAELGLDLRPQAPLVVTAAGAPVAAADVERHLRVARSIRVSIEGNAELCRGLLETRYGTAEEVAA
jgi:metal-sulfur cluster biosynthetic enzyme